MKKSQNSKNRKSKNSQVKISKKIMKYEENEKDDTSDSETTSDNSKKIAVEKKFINTKPLNPYYLFCQEKINENKDKKLNLNFQNLSLIWLNLPQEKIKEYFEKFKLLESGKKENKKIKSKKRKSNDNEYVLEEKFSGILYSSSLEFKKKISKSISKLKINSKLDSSFSIDNSENKKENINKRKKSKSIMINNDKEVLSKNIINDSIEISKKKQNKKKIVKSKNSSFKRKYL